MRKYPPKSCQGYSLWMTRLLQRVRSVRVHPSLLLAHLMACVHKPLYALNDIASRGPAVDFEVSCRPIAATCLSTRHHEGFT